MFTRLGFSCSCSSGEIIVVNEVNFVRKCIGADSSQDDLWGKLICTNFKVSFATHDSLPQQRLQCVHRLLGEHDVPLACVEQVVTVNDAKGKQKVLGCNKKLKFNPTELILYCKDFRIVRFRFDEAGPESAKKRVNGVDPGGGLQTPLFDCSSDWDREIKRTGASEWRVCSINEDYLLCGLQELKNRITERRSDFPLSVLSCQDFALSKSISLGKDQSLRFPPVWDWSQQFSLKDQTLFNNPLFVGKSAPCVHNGTVRTFAHKRSKKNYSSTLRGVPTALRNGVSNDHDTLPRRNSLMPRLRPDLAQLREQQESPAERFLQDWLSRPADPQGLLLPQLLPSHLPLWKLYFLRWVPEARIPHGGPVTAFHKLSVLADEIEMLQNQLRQYNGGATPALTPSTPPRPEPCRMYFRAGLSPCETPPAPEYLSSSFPFSPVGNLCRRSILGTPLSKFLNGAKIWLSTETLANESL
uniref:Myotubularin related protein 10 n=1 Tax=Astyanax mexicanus TaxID=7994 RepID=A0A8B9GZQ7_ASTMX